MDEDNKATPLALKWRLDTGYEGAVGELAEKAYPQGLRDIAPPGHADRNMVIRWFLQEGLGQGAAGNKAATYLLVTSPAPNEAPARSGAARGSEAPRQPAPAKAAKVDAPRRPDQGRASARPATRSADSFPLNINVQIHISADAGSEQIESIFAAMRRYLYDAQSH